LLAVSQVDRCRLWEDVADLVVPDPACVVDLALGISGVARGGR